MKWSLWSNAAFIVPALLSLHKGIIWHASLITLTMLLSALYHAGFPILRKADIVCAILLMAGNTYLLLTSFDLLAFLATLLIAAYAFYFFSRRKEYDRNHALWHLCSAIITTICILVH